MISFYRSHFGSSLYRVVFFNSKQTTILLRDATVAGATLCCEQWERARTGENTNLHLGTQVHVSAATSFSWGPNPKIARTADSDRIQRSQTESPQKCIRNPPSWVSCFATGVVCKKSAKIVDTADWPLAIPIGSKRTSWGALGSPIDTPSSCSSSYSGKKLRFGADYHRDVVFRTSFYLNYRWTLAAKAGVKKQTKKIFIFFIYFILTNMYYQYF